MKCDSSIVDVRVGSFAQIAIRLLPGRLPYGATKAALEAMSAVWAAELAATRITVNVLIPGGPTDTAFVADGSGISRDQMLKPEIMGPPASWLLSDASQFMTGQRIVAAQWDMSLPAVEAARVSSRAIGWPELSTDVIWPGLNTD